jgi:hypothetical protein
MDEIWTGAGLPENYWVSNLGRVKVNNKILSLQKKKGAGKKYYYSTTLVLSPGIQKGFRVHRLVAMAFIENPENKPCVNHKDGDTLNNSVENLEWCTYSENMKHAYRYKLKKSTIKNRVKANKISTEDIYIFDSTYDAARKLGIAQSNICSCCTGKRKQTCGYTFWYT